MTFAVCHVPGRLHLALRDTNLGSCGMTFAVCHRLGSWCVLAPLVAASGAAA